MTCKPTTDVFALAHPSSSSGLLLRWHLSLHNSNNTTYNNLLPSRSLPISTTHNQKIHKNTPLIPPITIPACPPIYSRRPYEQSTSLISKKKVPPCSSSQVRSDQPQSWDLFSVHDNLSEHGLLNPSKFQHQVDFPVDLPRRPSLKKRR